MGVFKKSDMELLFNYMSDSVGMSGEGLAELIVDLENGDELIPKRVFDAYRHVTDKEFLEILRVLIEDRLL